MHQGPTLRLRREVWAATEVFSRVSAHGICLTDISSGPSGVRTINSAQAGVLAQLGIGGPHGTVGGRLVAAGLQGSLYGGLVACTLRGALARPAHVGVKKAEGPPPDVVPATPVALHGGWVSGLGGDGGGIATALAQAGKFGTVVCGTGGAPGQPHTLDGWVPLAGVAAPIGEVGAGKQGKGPVLCHMGPILAVSDLVDILGDGGKVPDGLFLVCQWASPPVQQALKRSGALANGYLWQYGRQVELVRDLAIVTGCGAWVQNPAGAVLAQGGSYQGYTPPHTSTGGRWCLIGPGGGIPARSARAAALVAQGGTSHAQGQLAQRAAALVNGVTIYPVGDQANAAAANVALARGVAALRGGVYGGPAWWAWALGAKGPTGNLGAGLLYTARLQGWAKPVFGGGVVITPSCPQWFAAQGMAGLLSRTASLYGLVSSVGGVVTDKEPWPQR